RYDADPGEVGCRQGEVVGHAEVPVPAAEVADVHRHARHHFALHANTELPVVAAHAPAEQPLWIEAETVGVRRAETGVGHRRALTVGSNVRQIALWDEVVVEIEPCAAR